MKQDRVSDFLIPITNGLPVCVIDEYIAENVIHSWQSFLIYSNGIGEYSSLYAEAVSRVIRTNYAEDLKRIAQSSGCYFADYGVWEIGDPLAKRVRAARSSGELGMGGGQPQDLVV